MILFCSVQSVNSISFRKTRFGVYKLVTGCLPSWETYVCCANRKWVFCNLKAWFWPVLGATRLYERKLKTLGKASLYRHVKLKGKTTHFLLMCVAQKRLWFNSLLTWDDVLPSPSPHYLKKCQSISKGKKSSWSQVKATLRLRSL